MQWGSFGEGEHDVGEHLLSNRPVSVCDAFCSESFCEPGANKKLLLCAISEPQLNHRRTKCHFRRALFMFSVYVLTLIPFFFFSC